MIHLIKHINENSISKGFLKPFIGFEDMGGAKP